MIQLDTRTGLIQADVFVTEGERSIGVVLYRVDKPIAAQSFDSDTLRRVKSDCLRWLKRRELDDHSKVALLEQIKESFKTLAAIREHGPDIMHDWLGPASSRRLPNIEETTS